jgi:CRP/FNR family cyclic AMP-dependent transcriptional regulator
MNSARTDSKLQLIAGRADAFPSRRLGAEVFPALLRDGTLRKYRKKQVIFTQGEPAEEVFCIEKGRVQISVASRQGKEAVIAELDAGSFFGQGCLTGRRLRLATATASTDCSVVRIGKAAMGRALRDSPEFSAMFISYLLSRNIRVEEDLLDQLFNTSEKRLARLLLLQANFGTDAQAKCVIPRISHETLAKMVGTTRSRVSFFMNKFRRLGLIDYNGKLMVSRSLVSVVLHD